MRPYETRRAQVAELVDALASGASGRKIVKVRVLSWAPSPPLELSARFRAHGSPAYRHWVSSQVVAPSLSDCPLEELLLR